MSIFIAGLAFQDPALGAAAKTGVLAASTVAGITGLVLLRLGTAPSPQEASKALSPGVL